MPTLEFVGQSAQDSDAIFAQSSRLVNLYREPIASMGQAQYLLKTVLGMTELADTGTLLVRQIGLSGGIAYAVANNQLFKASSAGSVENLGAVVVGENCSVAANNGVVTIAGEGLYYTWDGATIAQPTAGQFDDFGSVDFLGNYSLLTEYGGRRFCWTDLADATTLPALNFATAEGRDGDLIRGLEINGNYWLFKSDSHEIWTLSGQSGSSAFTRLAGGVRDIGLKGYNLITKLDGGGFFVGDDGICYLVSGAQLQPISIPAVETAITAETPKSCFYYEDEGHKICVVRFRNRPSWCYDMSTGEWHERAEGVTLGSWSASCSVRLGNSWVVGTEGGLLSTLGKANTDNGAVMRRTAVSRTLYLDGARFGVSALEFRGRFGRSDLGRDAACYIRISRDNSLTYGDEMQRSVGNLGDYDKRLVYRRLGAGRQFTVEWNMTDPTDFSLLSDARIEVAA
jgi:hypothetical protein